MLMRLGRIPFWINNLSKWKFVDLEKRAIERLIREVDWVKVYDKSINTHMIGQPRLDSSNFIIKNKGSRYKQVKDILAILKYDMLRFTDKIDNIVSNMNSVPIYVRDKIRLVMKANGSDDDTMPYYINFYKQLNLRNLIGYDTLFGKITIEKKFEEDFFKKRLNKWFFNDFQPKFPTTDEFYKEFENQMNIIMDQAIGEPVKFIPFDEFFRDFSSWTTPGATDMKAEIKQFNIEGMEHIVSNKWSSAYAGIEELLAIVKDRVSKGAAAEIKYILKPEPNSVRLIILGDTQTYVIKSYIQYLLSKILVNVEGLFVTYTDDEKAKFWQERREAIRLGKTILDIDYSGWDEGVTKRMLEIFYRVMINKVNLLYRNVDFGINLDYIIRSLYNTIVLGLGKTTSGQPSGDKWTALGNSMINKVLNKMVAKKLNVLDTSVVLGDDVDVIVDDAEIARAWMDEINNMGFTVNKLKSFISQKEGEFLKMFYDKNNVSGHPTRMLRSIIWSTEAEQHLIGDEKRYTRINNWAQFLSRINMFNIFKIDLTELESIISTDMYNAFNHRFSKRVWLKHLRTPNALGGAGLFPDYFNNTHVDWHVVKDIPKDKVGKLKQLKLKLNMKNKWIGNIKSDNIRRNVRNTMLDIVTGGKFAKHILGLNSGVLLSPIKISNINKLYINSRNNFPNFIKTNPAPSPSVYKGIPLHTVASGHSITKEKLINASKKLFLPEKKLFVYKDSQGKMFTEDFIEESFLKWFYSIKNGLKLNAVDALIQGIFAKPKLVNSASILLGEVLSINWWNVVAPRLSEKIFYETKSFEILQAALVTLEVSMFNLSKIRQENDKLVVGFNFLINY